MKSVSDCRILNIVVCDKELLQRLCVFFVEFFLLVIAYMMVFGVNISDPAVINSMYDDVRYFDCGW